MALLAGCASGDPAGPTAPQSIRSTASLDQVATIPPGQAQQAGATALAAAGDSPSSAVGQATAAGLQGGTLTGPLGSVEFEQRPNATRAGVGLDLGPGVRVDAVSDAEKRRLAAAWQIARGLSLGAASDGDMSRAAIAWRHAQAGTVSGTAGADGTYGAGVKVLDRFGFSLEQSPNEVRQRISVDVVPGLSVETSGVPGSTGQAPDDRIGVKWRVPY